MSFYNIKNLRYLLDKDCSVVITGDSLAYNRYDFVDDPRQNAWECPLGMKSWSFLLRDFLISNSAGWTPASSLEISGPAITTYPFKKYNQRVPQKKRLPFEEEGVVIPAPARSEIIIKGCLKKIKGCPKKNILFITDPINGGVIETETGLVDLKGNRDCFEGRYFSYAESGSGTLRTGGRAGRIFLAGVSDTQTEVHLTGSGGKTAEWLLENSHDRIFRHNPGLCILIIGANNRRENNPSSFKGALKILIDRLIGSGAEILLISPPHSSTTDPPEDKANIFVPHADITKPLLDIMGGLADDRRIPYMNLFEFFSGIPGNVWRYDNTHFTKKGNSLLFEAIRDKYFGGEKNENIDSDRS
ncbi:MAG: SGNH/GDSL hydrolase family protein [Clostridia bacterium]